jgi:DNA-directed RNA polymerase II subunit RPB2
MNQSTIMCDSIASSRSTGKIVSIRKPAKKTTKKVEATVVEPEKLVVETPNPKDGPATIEDVIDRAMSIAKGTIEGVSPQEKNVLEHLGTYTEEPYEIIESYFEGQHLERLVRHQIESFNHFTNYQMQRTIQMFNPVVIRSENDFVAEKNQYFLEVQVSFENFKLYPPQIHENNGATKIMLPQEAKLRNFTYASTMTVDVKINYIVRNTEAMDTPKIITKTLPKINIGKMPIMLKSAICVLTQNSHIHSQFTGECAMDCGGYFIIKGSEKTVLGQERAAENRVYCFDGKNTTKWDWVAEIKSIPDFKCISPKQIEMMISSKNCGFGKGIYVNIPRIKQPIELFVVFRALGIISDRSICEKIILDISDELNNDILNALQGSIVEANKYLTQEDAIRHITSHVAYTPMNMDRETGQAKKREFANEVLGNDLFPHCKTAEQKIYMLGYMAKKLIQTSLGWLPPDDRDSYINKRIDLTGTLLNNLFRNYFNKLVKEMQKQVVREINVGSWRSTEDYENIINMTNIYKIMKSTTIENGITRALSTGDFSIKQANSSKVGVAQVLNRLTYASTLSHSRRVNTPLEKSGELIAPRKLHNTTWGFLCPAETPEGQSIGVVKNISYMAHITIPTNSSSLYEYVDPFILKVEEAANTAELHGKVKVFVNGTWVGVTVDPFELYTEMKSKKHKGIINIYTSIIFDFKLLEIRICNDGGRLTRPLLRVKDNRAVITLDIISRLSNKELSWNDMLTSCRLDESVIEYIDPEEQNFSMIAMKTKEGYLVDHAKYDFTHCEIHPSTIFGVLASCIPFPEHNQAPRNTYQCAMGKQAIGVYSLNYDQRMDKTAYVLTYPSRPLVDTRLMNFIHLNQIPSGCQIHVAIMTHTGYNQEDSVLVNKGSIDRGLFAATIYHTEKDEDKNIIRDEIIRCNPDKTKTKGIKFGNYDKVNAQGFIPENTLVENRDVIIAKIIPIKENRNDPTKTIKYEDQSKTFRTTEETYIDKNYTGRNGDGYNFAKVRVRVFRKPGYGDKFSSRHGQKGTCGNVIPECDMPFTKEGLKPDIIINPHAIPSRMTIAQLKETLLGKVLLELGMFGDGTSFGNLDIKTIIGELQKLGYESHGNEVMYNGLTGEQLETSIFIGPVFYQRLKHMVADKQHSRAIGPMVNLTRQPAEGRSRDGGFRIGEMERDVMIAHGMSKFCRERLYDVSDKYSAYVCRKCGMLAAYNDGSQKTAIPGRETGSEFSVHLCNTCHNMTDFARVEIPYAYKLMSQELQTINVVPRLITE